MTRQNTLFLTTASLFSLISLGSFQPVFAQGQAGRGEVQLKRTLAELCRKHDVPSLTVAAVRKDEIVAVECFGVRKRGLQAPVKLADHHPLGSCTKALTATLAAVLVDNEKITWDTTISQVWPKATDTHLHPALRDVTLDELLAHQSGVTSNISGNQWLSFFQEKSSPTLERRRMLGLILKRKPEESRGKYHYSNLGYVIASAMLETRGGDSFENLMQRFVFDPLEMDSAHFRTLATAQQQSQPLLWGHMADGTPVDPRNAGSENPTVYAGCGTVHLSVEDYAKYARWHVQQKPEPVLKSQESFEHLHTAKVEAPETGGKYGSGWIFVKIGPLRAMNHLGSNTNSQALIWILPDRDFAAIALTNTNEKKGYVACDEAIQEMMKRYIR